jgi:hypothetical protein
MKELWNKTFNDDKGKLKHGHEYHILYKKYHFSKIGVILRWHNGKLHDDGELPAVEFQDSHIEHYRNGLLHNDAKDNKGKLIPAIISNYAKNFEYFLNGNQIQQ